MGQVANLLSSLLLICSALSQPLLPTLSDAQTAYLVAGPTQFVSFGVCTFNSCQQNSPYHPASSFAPTARVDTDQWVSVAQSWGASSLCLTVHHTGGFALWPSKAHNYTIAQSPYEGGNGDIVRDFVASVRTAGLKPCFYIIPSWSDFVTRTQPNITAEAYLAIQLTMLSELLTMYGPIYRIWFDNYMLDSADVQQYAVPGFTGAALADTWATIVGHVKMLSPNTLMLPGPDGCLNPGEGGDGIYPVWNYQQGPTVYWGCGTTPPSPNASSTGYFAAPRESDYSVLNPGDHWFWDASDAVLGPEQLWASYTDTIGRGSQYILNVPPDRSGSVPAPVAAAAAGLGRIINCTYGAPVGAVSGASLPPPAPCGDYLVELELPPGAAWDEIASHELLSSSAPQLIAGYRLDVRFPNGSWSPASSVPGFHGATVGARVVDWGFLPYATAGMTAIRFVCTASLEASANVSLTLFAAYDGSRCWPNATHNSAAFANTFEGNMASSK
jgi:alpha-L-fucosidase